MKWFTLPETVMVCCIEKDLTKALGLLPKEDAKTIPVIAMTANAYAEDVANCLKAGMNAHIAKPIEPLILYETISQNMVS